MTTEELNTYADRIELIMISNRIAGCVAGGKVLPDGKTVRFMINGRMRDLERIQDEVRASLGASSIQTRRYDGWPTYEVAWQRR